MIAGLIKETTRQDIDGTPGLKKLPVLGQLVPQQGFQANETELVVIVTPILVRPTSQSQADISGQGFCSANRQAGDFHGSSQQGLRRHGDGPQGNYHGNVGFIVE